MYICKKHGELKTEWCDQCNDFVICDCSTTETTRWKDLNYGDKYWSATVYLEFCPVCGDQKSVWLK